MKLKRKKLRYQPNLDITSLIDVVFLLLVFLLVTMTFDKTPKDPTKEAIIDIELATASSLSQEPPSETLSLLVTEAGKLYLEGDAVLYTAESLKMRLAEELVSKPNIAVNVRADHRATHGEVVAALDLLKSLNIERVNLVIELKKGE